MPNKWLYLQYFCTTKRCTPIGNILDEGNSKKLNTNEETKIDSLMGKLGVNNDDDEINEKEKSSNTKDKKDTKNSGSKTSSF